ncbi:hypothetical protein K439DRAFT_1409339 [Ramaria rubella]|nr:hypothetical protein K439DRAFT_1409339 [Ramaria rubella]
MDPNAATADGPEERNGAVGPQPQRSSISSLLFLTFMLFLMTGGGSEDASIASKTHYKESLVSLKHQQANYTAWLNGSDSNFAMPPEDSTFTPFVHSLLPTPLFFDGQNSYYHNISGFLNGRSKFYNLTALPSASNESESTPWYPFADPLLKHAKFNTTQAAERIGTFNWTGIDKVTITVLELQREDDIEDFQPTEELNLMHGKAEIINPNESSELRLQIEGVHFPANGSFVGFATSKGRSLDIRELPSLVPPYLRNATAQAVALELDRRVRKLSRLVDSGIVENELDSNDEAGLPNCSFVFYFQLKPSNLAPHLMEELESELDNPTGVSTVRAPPLLLDSVFVSKDCGILLETREAKGMKVQKFWRKATTYAGYAFIVYLGLLVVLARQVESDASRTPAGLSRVSRWSFIAQAGADAISFIGHLTFGIFSDNRSSLSLIAPGFLACLLLVYQAQYAILINQIQGPEDAALRETARTIDSSDRSATPNIEIPAEANTQSPMGSLGAIRHRLAVEPQTRFWLLVVVSMVFFFNLVFSPVLAIFAIGMIYSFLWTPQIVRSARRGSRPGLNKDYLIGSTLGRLFFALYIFGCPENVLGIDSSPYVWVIVLLVVFQVLVIVGQDTFGPSFFLPKGWINVRVYDYHPLIPTPDAEAPKQSLGDCAICMEPIMVHSESPVGSTKGTSSQLLSSTAAGLRRVYALAPCHHVFHTQCLEQWLAIKNICPQCRRPLPPL